MNNDIENELNKKFEELFVSELIENAYEKWHDKKINERDDRNWVQKVLPLAGFVFIFIGFIGLIIYMHRDRVEQEVHTFRDNSTKYCTWVYVNDKIVQSWITDPAIITDSAIQEQKKQGLATLKKLTEK